MGGKIHGGEKQHLSPPVSRFEPWNLVACVQQIDAVIVITAMAASDLKFSCPIISSPSLVPTCMLRVCVCVCVNIFTVLCCTFEFKFMKRILLKTSNQRISTTVQSIRRGRSQSCMWIYSAPFSGPIEAASGLVSWLPTMASQFKEEGLSLEALVVPNPLTNLKRRSKMYTQHLSIQTQSLCLCCTRA